MQRTQFFNDTVRRNMGLLHTVSEEEMDMVAKCLDLYDEMHTLENGMGYRDKDRSMQFLRGTNATFGYYEEYFEKFTNSDF